MCFPSGEKKEIISPDTAWVVVLGWLVDTDGTNDATLRIRQKTPEVLLTTINGFTVTGTDDHGGVMNVPLEMGRLKSPAVVELTGTGATAIIGWQPGI